MQKCGVAHFYFIFLFDFSHFILQLYREISELLRE